MSAYMAYLPYPVRHSRNVSAAAKLLYAELTTFTDKDASTRVKNADLCKLFGVDERTISRWLIELKKAQFIEVLQSGPERIITISFDRRSTPTKMSVYPDKNVGLTPTKMSGNTLYTSFTNVKGSSTNIVSTEVLQQQPEIQRPAPPTLIEVKNYAEMHGISVTLAEKFWNHYQSSDWELRPGQPLKRWQYKLLNWKLEDRDKAERKQAVSQQPMPVAAVSQVSASEQARLRQAYAQLEGGANG